MPRILGIDPGSRLMGYGLIDSLGSKIRHVDNGVLVPPSHLNFNQKILYLNLEVTKLIQVYHPDVAAIENVFYGKNVQSMLKLGQARAAALIAILKADLELYEYSPTKIKQAVVAYGRAGKEQIQKMVKTLLSLKEVAQSDASDALAVAICHSQSKDYMKLGRSA